MIDVLVPVLGRPHNATALAESLAASTTVPYQLVWICSDGDDAQIAACHRLIGTPVIVEWQPGHADYARKINHAFTITSSPFVFQAADDVEFTAGWDVHALTVADRTGAGVVGTNDAANPMVKRGDHATHSLIRRSYVDEHGATVDGPGLVLSEAYGHQWCDNELVQLAKHRGQWAFAEQSVVKHRHWVWGTAPKDPTYLLGSATARQDARLFRDRSRRWAA